MKTTITRFVSMAAFVAGAALAQSPALPNPPQPPAQHRQWNRGQRFDRMAAQLNLTDDQKQQVRSIWQAAHASSRPLAQQLRQSRQALRDAVKAGKSGAELDQLSANVGNLAGQMATIRAKASSQVYALLTPEQRAKADQMHDHVRGMFMRGQEQPGGSGF